MQNDSSTSALPNRDNLQGSAGTTGLSGAPGGDADRRRRISERAYYKAEGRGFAAGSEEADWLAAEKEQDAEDARR